MTAVYSIRVFTTEGRYAAETVTADTYTEAACLFLGAMTWMDTCPDAAVNEVQLVQIAGDLALSIAYNDEPARQLVNEAIQNRAKADYLAALKLATRRWCLCDRCPSMTDDNLRQTPGLIASTDPTTGGWTITYCTCATGQLLARLDA